MSTNATSRLLMLNAHLQTHEEKDLLPEFPMLLRYEREQYDGKFHSTSYKLLQKSMHMLQQTKLVGMNGFARGFTKRLHHDTCIERIRNRWVNGNSKYTVSLSSGSKWKNLTNCLSEDLNEIRILLVSIDADEEEECDIHDEIKELFNKPTTIKTVSDYTRIVDELSDDNDLDMIIIDSIDGEVQNIRDLISSTNSELPVWLNVKQIAHTFRFDDLNIDYLSFKLKDTSIFISKHKLVEGDMDDPSQEQLQALERELS
ncbi:uncharacterized protein RJT21DRAFT_1262 [Scheffersomyces amazonensis]|uniref:uncharacterized protein n=1 Tax=Scheffersomyces amazonensis TaxID=1078765 RepID=UPI00315C73B3